MKTTELRHLNKQGQTKYYASYQSAWRAAIRLNEAAHNGTWLFEADINGWYLHFEQDNI
jgi:hypothetical protein